MTIREAIGEVDRLRKNTYAQKDKISWLSRLDLRVKHKVLDTHQGNPAADFAGYNEKTELDTQLLVPAPYDEMYLRYLEAQMEYYDQQEDRYNNAIDLFDSIWDDFVKWYNRNHMPLGQKLKF